jgi:hypothetical protein
VCGCCAACAQAGLPPVMATTASIGNVDTKHADVIVSGCDGSSGVVPRCSVRSQVPLPHSSTLALAPSAGAHMHSTPTDLTCMLVAMLTFNNCHLALSLQAQ